MALDTKERFTPEGSATDDAFAAIASHPDNADLRALEESPKGPGDDSANERPTASLDNPLNYRGPGESQGPAKKSLKGRWVKGGIGAILSGGGIIAIVSFMPAFGIGQMHALVDKVFGGSSTIQQTRAEQWIHNKIFGGTGQATSCSTVTYRCRITTMSADEVKTLKENGYELIANKEGKALEPDKNGRYAKAYAVREIDNPKNVFTASKLRAAIGTNAKLYGAFSAIYPSRIAVLRDTIAQKIFGERSLTRNPKTTEGDADPNTEEGRAKNVAKNLSDEQANPQVAQQADDALGDLKESVDEAITAEKADIANGTPKTGASNVLAVSEIDPPKINVMAGVTTEVKGAAQGLVIDTANTICTGYSRAKLVVNLARLAGTAAAIAYGIHLFAVFEKAISGDSLTAEETSTMTNDVNEVMTSLNREDSSGTTGSDSAGYAAYMYNQVSANPITSPITGGAFLTSVVALVMFVKKANINGVGADSFCGTLLSGPGQIVSVIAGIGVQSLAAFFSGGFSLTSSIAQFGLKEGVKIAVKEIVGKVVKKSVEEMTKEDIKLAVKTLGKQVLKESASIGGLMLISYLVDQFVVPYVAKLAAGTITTGSAGGGEAMNTAISGLAALNAQNWFAHGGTTMTKAEYLDFSKYADQKEAEYIAMQRSVSNPFDISNPYSVSGSIAVQAYPSLSKLDIFSDPSKIASLPMAILSMFSGSHAGSTTAYAATTDQREELLSQCQDQDIVSDKDVALDIFCNPFVGFNDLGMLQNTSTLDVLNYMTSHNQVDDNNNPIPGSDYANFYQQCVEGAENKTLSTLVDDNSRIDPQCVDPTYNARTDIKYFRLSAIDNFIDKGIPSGTAQAAQTGTCPTAAGITTQVVSGITQGWEYSTGAEKSITLCSIPGTEMSTIPLWTDSRYEGTSAAGVTTIAVNSEGAASLAEASAAAKKEGVTLKASIGYRSLNEQCSILAKPGNLGSKLPSECPSWVTAVPGNWSSTTLYSNHLMGYSIDFVDTTSKNWMLKCMKEGLGGTANRCYGFWNDVYQTQHWDEGHFTYDP